MTTPSPAAGRRTQVLAELRARMQRVRGAMADDVFEELLERMTEQRLADERRTDQFRADGR